MKEIKNCENKSIAKKLLGIAISKSDTILGKIFECLDIAGLMNCRLVNQSWKLRLDKPEFWLRKLRQMKSLVLQEPQIKKWRDLIKESKRRNVKGSQVSNIIMAKIFRIQEFKENQQFEVNYPVIHTAIIYGDVDLVKILAEQDPDFLNFEIPDYTFQESPKNYLLFLAVESGHNEIVKFMMSKIKGPFSELKNLDNETPLHIAARNGNVELVKFFVTKLSNTSFQDNVGNTAIHSLLRYYPKTKNGEIQFCSDRQSILMLLASKTDLRISSRKRTNNVEKSQKYHTPLELALRSKNYRAVEVLAPLVYPLPSSIIRKYKRPVLSDFFRLMQEKQKETIENIEYKAGHRTMQELKIIVKCSMEKQGRFYIPIPNEDNPATFQKFMYVGEKVFSHLSIKDLVKLRLVCQTWNNILLGPSFWLKKMSKCKKPTVFNSFEMWAALRSEHANPLRAEEELRKQFSHCLMAECIALPTADSMPPIAIAVRYGHFEVVKLIIEKYGVALFICSIPNSILKGQSDNLIEVMKWYLLFIAIECGHTEIAKYLVKEIPKPIHHVPFPFMETPLHTAARYGNLELLKELAPFFDVNVLDYYGNTAIHGLLLKYPCHKLINNCAFKISESRQEILKYLAPSTNLNIYKDSRTTVNFNVYQGKNIRPHLKSYPNNLITCQKCLCQIRNQKATQHFASHDLTNNLPLSKRVTPLDLALKHDHWPSIAILAPLTRVTVHNFNNCKSEKMKQSLMNIAHNQIPTKAVVKKTKMTDSLELGELPNISFLTSKRRKIVNSK